VKKEGVIWMKQIWSYDVLDEYELSPLTLEKVESAENELKVKLPDSYLKLLKEQNGGSLYLNAFPISYEGEDYLAVDYLLGIGESKREGIQQSGYFIKEWELPKRIVLLCGDGHTWIALDYREVNENPPVIFIDVELEIEKPLSSSFEEFVSKLYHIDQSNSFENIIFEGDQTEFTYEEGEKVFRGNTVGVIGFALLHFNKIDCDVNWYIHQIGKLAKKKNEFIVQDAEMALMKIIINKYDSPVTNTEGIQEIVTYLTRHQDDTVRNYANKLQRLINQKKINRY
jgi:hypothetical protein